MQKLVLLDTTVFIHAFGNDRSARDAATRILSAVAERKLQAVVSIETVQEVLFVRSRKTGDHVSAVNVARDLANSYPVLGAVDADLPLVFELATRNPSLGGRDALILASAINAGISTVVSSDRAFAGVTRIECIDPSDAGAVRALIG